MTPSQFEKEVVRQISTGHWTEVARVFRLLDEAYTASRPQIEIENAIRVSFLESFEFQEHENRVRQRLGPSLTVLYDDQMRYMEDLARRAAEQRAAADTDGPRH